MDDDRRCELRDECKFRFEALESEIRDFAVVKDDVHEMKETAKAIKNWVIGAFAMLVIQQFGLIEIVKGILF